MPIRRDAFGYSIGEFPALTHFISLLCFPCHSLIMGTAVRIFCLCMLISLFTKCDFYVKCEITWSCDM